MVELFWALCKTHIIKNIFLSGKKFLIQLLALKKNIFDPVTGFQIFSIIRYSLLMLTAIVLAHSNLSLSQIGMYETMLLFSGMFSFFYVGALTTKLLSSKPEEKDKNYKLVLIALLLISVSIAAILLIFKDSVASVFNISNTIYIKFFACYIIFNTPGFLLEYFFLIERKIKALIVYAVTYGTLYFFVVACLSFNNYSVEAILTGLIVLAFARLGLLLILVFRKSHQAFLWTDLTRFCVSSFPLLLSLMLSGSADYIDSFLALNYFGQEQLAIFKYGAKELPLSLLMANALSNAMVPVLSGADNFSQSVSELKKRTTNLIRVVFPFSIILMLSAKWIYPIIFSDRFAESSFVFCIYLLLVCSRVMFPQTLLLAKGHYSKIAVASGIELVINVTASIFFLKYFGISGIALGTVTAFMFEKFILFYFVKMKFDISSSDIIPVREYLIFTGLLLGSFYVIWFF